MAVNRIHKIYDKTSWRPTHYVKTDFSTFDGGEWRSEVMQHIERGEKCLLWDYLRDGPPERSAFREYISDGLGELSNVTYVPRCEVHTNRIPQSWHLPEICTSPNSISVMAQWAVLLGYTEIYLVGCDGQFSTPDKDHFDTNYYAAVDDDYERRNNEMVLGAHRLIKESCPVPVYNATVGGVLEMYPRVKLEDVVNG